MALAGAKATHVAINPANTGGLAFWEKMGFTDLMPPGRTVWKGRK
jgi:hypothetical protein